MNLESLPLPNIGPEVNVGSSERIISALAGSALALYGASRKDLPGVLLAAAGGLLVLRGSTGHCSMYKAAGVDTAHPEQRKPIEATEATTIGVSAEQLYQFWRDFENLPRIMHNLESVRNTGDGKSVWRAKGPAGTVIEWQAEITEDVPNRRIAWHSVGKASVPNSGVVQFRPAPADRGTEVQVDISYDMPGGKAGQALASLLMSTPEQEIREDLRRFKQLMETGDIITIDGQPAAHRYSMFGFLSSSAK